MRSLHRTQKRYTKDPEPDVLCFSDNETMHSEGPFCHASQEKTEASKSLISVMMVLSKEIIQAAHVLQNQLRRE